MLKDFDQYYDHNKRYVEINVSCPNVDDKIIGYHLKLMENLLNTIRFLDLKNTYIGIKLPPYFEKYKIKKMITLFNNFDEYYWIYYLFKFNSKWILS